MRALGIDPVHDTRSTFRALVDAMARPGTVESVPVTPADHAVLATLVDHEVTIATEDDQLVEALSNAGRYEPAPLDGADLVHACGSTDGRIVEAERGTLKEPSDGATAVYRVDGLVGAVDEASDASVTLRIAGPGVPGHRRLGVAGLPPAEADAVATLGESFPRGVDVVLTASDQVAALPRSVTLDVEVV
jgi:alpha-D-ribose 1-methylphosphonate 5-triphosphate synthase subunit PhnH